MLLKSQVWECVRSNRRKHTFGRRQTYHELIDTAIRDRCMSFIRIQHGFERIYNVKVRSTPKSNQRKHVPLDLPGTG